jgi:hypothetical protein
MAILSKTIWLSLAHNPEHNMGKQKNQGLFLATDIKILEPAIFHLPSLCYNQYKYEPPDPMR